MQFVLSGGLSFSNNIVKERFVEGIFVMAHQEGYFKLMFTPNSSIMGVVFRASVFSKLFNLPMNELTNKATLLTDHIGKDYHECWDRLLEANSNEDRVRVLNAFFLDKIANLHSDFDQVDWLIDYIRVRQGQVSVEELAAKANLSVRSLQRKLDKKMGLSPKSYSMIVRFNYALLLLKNYPNYDWQDILYKSGFFDQNHFIKEFKRYTGQTPGSFVRGEHSLMEFFDRNNLDDAK